MDHGCVTARCARRARRTAVHCGEGFRARQGIQPLRCALLARRKRRMKCWMKSRRYAIFRAPRLTSKWKSFARKFKSAPKRHGPNSARRLPPSWVMILATRFTRKQFANKKLRMSSRAKSPTPRRSQFEKWRTRFQIRWRSSTRRGACGLGNQPMFV